MLYKKNGTYSFDLFDRGGMVKSRMTATFFHTVDPSARLKWHHVRAIKMDPARGFWLRYRLCFRHVDLSEVPAETLRDSIVEAIQSRLHPEGFDFRGHCCWNFASDLMEILGSLRDGDPLTTDFVRVPLWQSNVFGLCCGVTLAAYLRRYGFDDAVDDLVRQERAAVDSRSGLFSCCNSAACCVSRARPARVPRQPKN